jgi:hypothetical protein
MGRDARVLARCADGALSVIDAIRGHGDNRHFGNTFPRLSLASSCESACLRQFHRSNDDFSVNDNDYNGIWAGFRARHARSHERTANTEPMRKTIEATTRMT